MPEMKVEVEMEREAVTHQLLSPNSKRSWWASSSLMKKASVFGLVVLVGVVGTGGALLASGHGDMIGAKRWGWAFGAEALEPKQADVCETETCVVAAESIMSAMDSSADPCEDFYQFACGGWMASNEIPDGKSRWGRFYELRDEVDNALHNIVGGDHVPESVAVNSLMTMYRACLDTDAIEAAGLSSVANALGPMGAQGGWPMVQDSWIGADIFHPSVAVGQQRRYLNQNPLLSIWVYLDDFETSQNVIYIDQPDLGLPMSMYLDVESYADYIAAYKNFMVSAAAVFARELGSSVTAEQLQASADEVFEFERQIAMIMTPDSERRNSTAMYNPMLVSELKETYGANFNWDAYLSAVFTDTGVTVGDDERVIVVQPSYFEASQNLQGSLETLSNYVHWRYVMAQANELTQEMRDIYFQYNSAMTGVATAPERWQTCVSKSVAAYGFAAGHEYIMQGYFDESAKAEADSMVEDLRSAFKELVTETDWMDADTQVVAQGKADQMLQLIGYPDWLTSEEEVDAYYEFAIIAEEDNHLGNVIGMKGFAGAEDLRTLRDVPNRDIWLMHPAIVNAWYSPSHNTITFPAGILQPPFFEGGRPRFLNYGAMGMVIGHEITHGFDDQGRQYDGTGNVSPWWSEATIENFAPKAQCFIDQYSNYTVPELVGILGEEDAHLNGKMTQGENIADNGGIREAYRAYVRSVESQGEDQALPGLEMYTSEQLLFVSYAQVWCEIMTTESLLGQVLGDPHSPGKFRVQGPLGNSEDFLQAFSCPADSSMNRPDKCILW